jgi:hypothetical protein
MTTLTMNIDAIARNLSQTSSRRQVFRLFGGGAALGALAAVGLDETRAKRKKHNKKRCLPRCNPERAHCVNGKCVPRPGPQQTEVCRPGEQIARLEVPSNGVPVQSPVLAQGRAYTVTVSGMIRQGNLVGLDAEYLFALIIPPPPSTIKDAVGDFAPYDVGLAIDDAVIDGTKSPKWGPYNPDHVYSQQIIGQGRPVSLQFHDDAYAALSGSLSVTIVCA